MVTASAQIHRMGSHKNTQGTWDQVLAPPQIPRLWTTLSTSVSLYVKKKKTIDLNFKISPRSLILSQYFFSGCLKQYCLFISFRKQLYATYQQGGLAALQTKQQ